MTCQLLPSINVTSSLILASPDILGCTDCHNGIKEDLIVFCTMSVLLYRYWLILLYTVCSIVLVFVVLLLNCSAGCVVFIVSIFVLLLIWSLSVFVLYDLISWLCGVNCQFFCIIIDLVSLLYILHCQLLYHKICSAGCVV